MDLFFMIRFFKPKLSTKEMISTILSLLSADLTVQLAVSTEVKSFQKAATRTHVNKEAVLHCNEKRNDSAIYKITWNCHGLLLPQSGTSCAGE